MIVSKAAKRYATAFLEHGEESKKTELFISQVREVLNLLSESSELVSLFNNPVISNQKKVSILTEIFQKDLDADLLTLIVLMVQKGRSNLVIESLHGYEMAYNELKNIQKVDITLAKDLGANEKKELVKALETRTRKTIEASYHVDEKIIGGVKVKIDDTVIDGSVQYKLQKMTNLFNSPL